MELELVGAGYRSVSELVPAATRAGSRRSRSRRPRHASIGNACFTDRGHTNVVLIGSAEARTVTQSATTLAGTASWATSR